MVRNPRFRPWEQGKIDWLKQNYNLSYPELEIHLKRTRRAIKHKVADLGLKRDERRRISDEEKEFIRQHSAEWSKDLAKQLGRSEFCVARLKRELLGSANPRFKEGWSVPSKSLAYFVGAICSDLGVYKNLIEISQKEMNKEMIVALNNIIKIVFGMNAVVGSHKKSCVVNGVKIENDYRFLRVCSNQFLKHMGTKSGVLRGNIRGEFDEWIEFVKEKFSWVFEKDEYFWSFVGGIYDGDGSLSRKKSNSMREGIWYEVTIAVKPSFSRVELINQLNKRGFDFRETTNNGQIFQIFLAGGQGKVDEFLGKIRSFIISKRDKKWSPFE